MRVRLEAYEKTYRKIRFRSVVLLSLGTIGLCFGGFATLAIGAFLPSIKEDDKLAAGVLLLMMAGIFPLIAAALMLWRGIVGRRRLHQLRDLGALSRSRPWFGTADVSMALRLSPFDAERVVLDATTLGIMEEGEPPPGMPGAWSYPPPPALPYPGTPQPPPNGISGVRPVQTPEAFARTVASVPPPRPGTGFDAGAVLNGTYRIEGRLGAGGMGLVYAARHLRTGRRYAIKTLLPDAQLSPDAIRRFEREATAASALGHPGIVAVHDFHETEGGVHYLVMDLLEGETLDARLSRAGSLPWPEARRVALEVGAALCAAHDRGLLHRDLKPANIFLTRTEGMPERAVLLDFGLAKPLSDARSRITVSGAAVGTPMYMSPEQARGEAVDVRSDVYGLGAVIYEMVTGAPPFLDRTLAGVYARLLTESAPAASAGARYPCPPAVDDILSCALAKTPGERFDSMRAFLGALSTVGEGAQRSA